MRRRFHTPHKYLTTSLLGSTLLGISLVGCTTAQSAHTGSAAPTYLVYVGTNVASDQENTIYLYRLTASTGALTPVGAYRGGSRPTYLALDARHHYLYAVSSQTQSFMGTAHSGGVSAFAVDAHTGGLTMLNQQPSLGAYPCYISLDHTEKNILVANYLGGVVSVLPRLTNGQLAAATFSDQHQPPTGPSADQEQPHAHCIIASPDNRYVLAVDHGTDKVYRYSLAPKTGKLSTPPTVVYAAQPGAGPRHLTFHPNGRWAYLENELNSTITALAYEAATGTFQELQTASTLPVGFTGANTGADVHVSPDGRFLYTSNRGDNSLAVFSIAPTDGRLALVQHVSTQGQTPRNFALDPTGRVLLVANQGTNNVFTYQVDKQTGKLTATGQSVSLPSPLFVAVVPDVAN